MKRQFLMVLMIVSLVFVISACGETEDDNNTTAPYLNDGTVTVDECKGACDKIASCMTSTTGADMTDFSQDCKKYCDQSGFFHDETIACIYEHDCTTVQDCGMTP